jgi:hypothetical protein
MRLPSNFAYLPIFDPYYTTFSQTIWRKFHEFSATDQAKN